MKIFHNKRGDETGEGMPTAVKIIMVLITLLVIFLLLLTPLGPFLLSLPDRLFGGI